MHGRGEGGRVQRPGDEADGEQEAGRGLRVQVASFVFAAAGETLRLVNEGSEFNYNRHATSCEWPRSDRRPGPALVATPFISSPRQPRHAKQGRRRTRDGAVSGYH